MNAAAASIEHTGMQLTGDQTEVVVCLPATLAHTHGFALGSCCLGAVHAPLSLNGICDTFSMFTRKLGSMQCSMSVRLFCVFD